MSPEQLLEADKLVNRCRAGDQKAWKPLRDLIERQMLKNTEKAFCHLEKEERASLEITIRNIFEKIIEDMSLNLESRDNYYSIYAHVTRHVWVEFSRRIVARRPW